MQSSSSSVSLSASDWLSLIIMSAPTAWLTARRNCFVLAYTPGILRVFCSYGFPYVIAPAFSTPAFSTHAIYPCIFRSCIFHPCCLLLLFPLPHFQRPRVDIVVCMSQSWHSSLHLTPRTRREFLRVLFEVKCKQRTFIQREGLLTRQVEKLIVGDN